MIKKLLLLLILSSFCVNLGAQNYPNVFGYAGGQQIELNDGIRVSFSGGSPFATQWSTHSSEDYHSLSGFRHNILFVDNALLARDARELRNHSSDIQPDVDLSFDYEDIRGDLQRVDIPIEVSFFWPDAGI